METKTRAVVLRMVKYGESKLVVDMFTEEHGRVAFMVSASNSHKGRNKRRLFQPLSLLYIRYDHRLKPGLQTLREASLAYPLSDLPTHPHKLPIAFFLSEFLCHATRDEQQNLPLFHFIAESVTWLDGAREGFANFHVVFMTRLTAFLGFMPNTEDYRPGYVLSSTCVRVLSAVMCPCIPSSCPRMSRPSFPFCCACAMRTWPVSPFPASSATAVRRLFLPITSSTCQTSPT